MANRNSPSDIKDLDDLTRIDEIVVDNLMNEISKDGYRMQTLIEGVITSYPFTHRRIVRKEDLP